MARVLLVEDDEDIAAVVEAILMLDGHTVERTPSGREALVWAAARPWDLVVLDVEIAELSGLGVERALRDFSAVPVLVTSASAGRWREEALAAGATACLPKPFELGQLRALVDALVRQRTHGGARDVDPETLSPEDLERLAALTPAELDALPYGVIQVDDGGVIVGFNRYESIAACMAPDEVLGKRFVEVAPCTRVQRFAGAIARGLAAGHLDEALRFVFPAFGGLAIVTVRLFFDAELRRMWIFVARQGVSRDQRWRAPSSPGEDLGSLARR